MPKENNKMQVDIDTLKKQNVNDLLSIKELYKRIEELGEKTTQIKHIDNTLVKKLKKEYEKLKKIILDENIQVKLTNDIETINSQQVKLTNDIKATNLQMKDNTNELKKMKTFEVFPTDDVLNDLPINSTFEVKGFYVEGDMPKCMYKKVGTGEPNSISKNGYCIKPITNNYKEVFMPYLGIRKGSSYGVLNSSIISQMNLSFGSTLIFPTGAYYFDRPLNLSSKQCSLIGKSISYTADTNTTGLTWLYFNNLLDNEYGVSMTTGTLANVIIKGNNSHYSYYLDRSKTYIDKDNIEQEIIVRKCYGIKGGSTTTIRNVHVEGFYWGCYLNTGNIYITDFYARSCHIGLSIGNDTKCKGIYGFDVHTLLQIRGSISSAVQVRCDSCYHLVQLIGYMNGNILTDLDADYCLGSVVKIGEHGSYGSVSNLTINGITGRHCCYNVYDKTKDNIPTSSIITSDTETSKWGFISVEKYNHLNGAIITMSHSLISDSSDTGSNYRTPQILLASGLQCNVVATFITTFKSGYGTDGSLQINRKTLLDSIYTKSQNANNTRISLITPFGIYYYIKLNASDIVTKSQSMEELT